MKTPTNREMIEQNAEDISELKLVAKVIFSLMVTVTVALLALSWSL